MKDTLMRVITAHTTNEHVSHRHESSVMRHDHPITLL
jgi:hypothetical protein